MAIKCSVSQPFWGPIMPRACVRITGRACALQWFHAVFRRKFYRLDSHKISSPTLLSLLVMCVSCSLSLSIRVRTTLRYATSKTPISTLTRQTKSSPSLLVPAKRSAPHSHTTPPPPFPICPPSIHLCSTHLYSPRYISSKLQLFHQIHPQSGRP
jgi:hypothetical protein